MQFESRTLNSRFAHIGDIFQSMFWKLCSEVKMSSDVKENILEYEPMKTKLKGDLQVININTYKIMSTVVFLSY